MVPEVTPLFLHYCCNCYDIIVLDTFYLCLLDLVFGGRVSAPPPENSFRGPYTTSMIRRDLILDVSLKRPPDVAS